MTRILLIATTLALVATTSFAAVTITATDEGDGQVRIAYVATEPIRAFALDITTDMLSEIDGIYDYNVGDNSGYGIFPGRFREAGIDPADPNWLMANYNPTAAGGDPDRQPGLTYAGITVEMGSLYTTGNEPDSSGTLFMLDINDNGGWDCNLCISLNETRGGIVNEDAEEVATVVLPPGGAGAPAGCIKVVGYQPSADCLPTDHPDYAEWESVGKPDCWCYPRQCHGDADGGKEGSAKGGYWYVGSPDLNILIPAWLVLEPTKGTGLSGNQICADFAHDKEGSAKGGYWRVGSTDLNAMLPNWLVLEPTKGTGVPPDCGGTLEP